MGITKEELEKSDELCAAATPGEWKHGHSTDKRRNSVFTDGGPYIFGTEPGDGGRASERFANAKFIAIHNPDYIKRLNAYVRELENKFNSAKNVGCYATCLNYCDEETKDEIRADERAKVRDEVLSWLRDDAPNICGNFEAATGDSESGKDVADWLESEWKKEENV